MDNQQLFQPFLIPATEQQNLNLSSATSCQIKRFNEQHHRHLRIQGGPKSEANVFDC